jgi:hypothetical protein
MSKSMDEVIVTDITCFHSERMSDNCYAIVLDHADGTQQKVVIQAMSAKVYCLSEPM